MSNPFSIYNPRLNLNDITLTLTTQNPQELQNQNTAIGKFMFSDSTDKDAFYRLRVSEPYTLFDGNTIYDTNPLFFDYQLVGNCSTTGPSGGVMIHTINSNASINDFSSQQSHYYAHYQPGKSFLALFSFLFGNPVTGITRRVGFYDVDSSNNFNPKNGILLEQTGNGVSWIIYQGSPGNQIRSVIQSNWNVDTFDGNGPSGVIIDFSKNCLGFIDLEWLGVGRVRCGFFINGVPLVAHVFNNTEQTLPYINNPYLPIRYEIRKTGTTGSSASMNAICCSIISEGGYNPIGVVTTLNSGIKNLTSSETVVLSLRLKSSYPRSIIIPISVEVASDLGGTTYGTFSIYLWRNTNYTVPGTWTPVSSVNYHSNSIAEYNTTDNYLSGTPIPLNTYGTVNTLYTTTISSSTKISLSDIPLSLLTVQSNVNELYRDVVLISITSPSGNKNFTTLLTWKEIL